METLVFNPTAKEADVSSADIVRSWKEVERKAETLQRDLIAKRREAKAKNPECVPVVHRRTGEVRFFNLAPNYQGSLQLAESLLTSQWRLATPEEEAAEFKRQEEERNKRVFAKAGEAAMKQASILAGQMSQEQLAKLGAVTATVPQSGGPAKQENVNQTKK